MPAISFGTILLGFVLGFALSLRVARRTGRRVYVPVALALGIAIAALLPYLPPLIGAAWGGIAIFWGAVGLPPLTGGAVFIGAWMAALVLIFAMKRHHPRRRLFMIGVPVFLLTAYALPPLLDRVTGSYQAASLRTDINQCTEGMLGRVQPRAVTNTCATPIVVGLCLPGEVNPTPCAQSIEIAPGQTVMLDPGEERLSSVPGNPNGLTVVACRPPDRPSRWGNTTGRGYRGVCLPPA